MSLVLGIDGGGTKTRVAIADAGRVVAHVECGSIKRLRVGAEVAEENLRLAKRLQCFHPACRGSDWQLLRSSLPREREAGIPLRRWRFGEYQ